MVLIWALKTRMKHRKATKRVRNPLDSERALYVPGSLGKASNLARPGGSTASSLSMKAAILLDRWGGVRVGFHLREAGPVVIKPGALARTRRGMG